MTHPLGRMSLRLQMVFSTTERVQTPMYDTTSIKDIYEIFLNPAFSFGAPIPSRGEQRPSVDSYLAVRTHVALGGGDKPVCT